MEAFNLAMLFIVPALLLFFGEEFVKRISLGVPLPPLVIKGSSTRNRTAPTAASSSSRRPAAPASQPENEPHSSTGLLRNGSHGLATQGPSVLDTPRSGSMSARSWQKVPAPGRHTDARTQAFFGELLEALAVEPGDALGFGFVVSAAKSPGPADMPKLLVKNPADVASAIASGETLIEVDGFKTSGMTAKDVKEIVSRASMRVRLTVQRLHGEPMRTVVLWRGWARPLVDLCERVTREMASSPKEAGPGAVQLEASLRHLMRALNDMASKVEVAEALCARRDASVGFERTLLSLYVAHIAPSALDPSSSSSLNLSRSSLKEQGDGGGAGRGGGGGGGGGKDTVLSQAPAEPTPPPASADRNAASMQKETTEGGAAEREAIGRYNLVVAAQRKAEKEAKERYDSLLEENAKREREGMARYNMLLARLRVEVEERDAEIRRLRGGEGGDFAYGIGSGAVEEDAHGRNGDDVDDVDDDDSDDSEGDGGGERRGGPGVSFSSRSGRSGGRDGARMSVMRHGQREDEVNEEWCSQNPKRPYDPPLTEKGKSQARAAGKVLAGRGVSVLVSSPFLRCLETAFEVIKGMEEGGSDTQDTVLYVDYGLSEVLSERNMKGVKPSPLCPSDLDHEVRQLLADECTCMVCCDNEESDEECIACRYGGGVPFPAYPETLGASARRYGDAFERIAKRFGKSVAGGGGILCVAHGDTVAQYMGDTRSGISKDDVYETPHCCWVEAYQAGEGGGGWEEGSTSGDVGVLMPFDD